MHLSVFLLLLTAFFLWGFWANTIKMGRGIRFEFYYLDFLVGIFLVNLLLLLFFGERCKEISSLIQKDPRFVILSIVSGVLFNVATFFLVAGISLISLSYSYLLCFGTALIIDTLARFAINHFNNILFLFVGILLVFFSLSWIRIAFQKKENQIFLIKKLSYFLIIGGVLMGLFHPILVTSITLLATENIPSFLGYFFFSLGVLSCNLLMYPFFMKKPIFGHSLENVSFLKMPFKSHIWGGIGGVLWAFGFYLNLLTHEVAGYALFFGVHEASILMAFLWGILFWKEISISSPLYKYVALSFLSYFLGALILGSSLM